MARLRRVLGEQSLSCERLSPIEQDDERVLIRMPDGLRHAIKDVLGRNRMNKFTPRLTFKGFDSSEREKFPAHWRITSAAGYFEPNRTFDFG